MQREFCGDLTVEAVDEAKDREQLRGLINAGVQRYATGLDREHEYDADLRGVVLAARAGYDPYAFLDVLSTIDSINPAAEELSVLMKTHPPTGDRLEQLTNQMGGKLDRYAAGPLNAQRFRRVTASP